MWGPPVVLQITVKNNLNVKVVLHVSTNCESNIYSPINLWKTACLEPRHLLLLLTTQMKNIKVPTTALEKKNKKSHSEITGELGVGSSVGIFIHTYHVFNEVALMSWCKTVNHKTLSLQDSFQGILGDDLFPCRLMFVQAVITPTPCVKEICCFATFAGCKPSTPSFCGWKTLRGFFEQRVKSVSNVEHLFFLLKLQQFSYWSVYRLH